MTNARAVPDLPDPAGHPADSDPGIPTPADPTGSSEPRAPSDEDPGVGLAQKGDGEAAVIRRETEI